MRWILCGKNDAAVAALEHLVARGDEIWVIAVAGDDGADRWQRSLVGAARHHGMPVDKPRRINDPDFVARLAAYGARALVSIQYDQILKGNLFRTIGCPCLNLHFALLPRHRGVAPIAWAVLSGDAVAGVTLHHMVEDIDAGDVVAQREVALAPDATARELYDRLTDAAVALFRESYPFPPELIGRRCPQDPAVASYHRNGDFDFSQRRVDWSRPAGELGRWIRAMIFPPHQHPETTWNGRTLVIQRLAAGTGAPRPVPPGTVVAVGPDGIDVAAGDGVLRITHLAGGAEVRVDDRLG